MNVNLNNKTWYAQSLYALLCHVEQDKPKWAKTVMDRLLCHYAVSDMELNRFIVYLEELFSKNRKLGSSAFMYVLTRHKNIVNGLNVGRLKYSPSERLMLNNWLTFYPKGPGDVMLMQRELTYFHCLGANTLTVKARINRFIKRIHGWDKLSDETKALYIKLAEIQLLLIIGLHRPDPTKENIHLSKYYDLSDMNLDEHVDPWSFSNLTNYLTQVPHSVGSCKRILDGIRILLPDSKLKPDICRFRSVETIINS